MFLIASTYAGIFTDIHWATTANIGYSLTFTDEDIGTLPYIKCTANESNKIGTMRRRQCMSTQLHYYDESIV